MIQINLVIPEQPKRIESLLFYYLEQISFKLGAFRLFVQSPLVHLKLCNILQCIYTTQSQQNPLSLFSWKSICDFFVFLIHKSLESILLQMICNKTHTLHVNREHLMTMDAEWSLMGLGLSNLTLGVISDHSVHNNALHWYISLNFESVVLHRNLKHNVYRSSWPPST